ncbi:MAG: response regulator transcription factor [Bacilli bacterium]
MEEKKKNILVVEDSKLLLDAMALFIEEKSDFEVVGKLTDIAEAEHFLEMNDVNIILSDIMTLNGHNAIEYIPALKKKFPNIKVVLMTSVRDVTFQENAKEAGVDSFVYKDIPIEELITVLNDTERNYSLFPNEKSNAVAQFKSLNAVEMSIIKLACKGYDNKEIAEEAGYSEKTIRNYVSNILTKTDFTSMSKLCIWATKNGYIS